MAPLRATRLGESSLVCTICLRAAQLACARTRTSPARVVVVSLLLLPASHRRASLARIPAGPPSPQRPSARSPFSFARFRARAFTLSSDSRLVVWFIHSLACCALRAGAILFLCVRNFRALALHASRWLETSRHVLVTLVRCAPIFFDAHDGNHLVRVRREPRRLTAASAYGLTATPCTAASVVEQKSSPLAWVRQRLFSLAWRLEKCRVGSALRAERWHPCPGRAVRSKQKNTLPWDPGRGACRGGRTG